ncbi:MAG: RT0821/Lpp0805 family surface protein [Pseudomonadota bacterium]
MRSLPSIAAVVGLSLALGGCAFGGNKLASVASTDQIVSQSVTTKATQNGVSQDDAEIIKKTVVAAKKKDRDLALAWTNPDTGSSGTIVAIDNFLGKHGQKCRGFKTTVATFMGIAFFDGEACQISPGEWVLSWFRPQDGKKS